MIKINKIFTAIILFCILPQVSLAAGLTDLVDAGYGLITKVLLPLAFALCLLYFFWGVVKYIGSGAGGEKAVEEGKKVMVWGVVGIFIAFSIWGIVALLKSELNIPPIQNINRP